MGASAAPSVDVPAGASAGGPRPHHTAALVLMSCFVPGSAHIATGRKRVGWAIVACFVLLVAAAVAVALAAVRNPGTAGSLLVQPRYLDAVRYGVIVLGVAWIAVVARAAFLTPHRGATLGKLVAAVVVLALAAVVGVPAVMVSRYAKTTDQTLNHVFKPAAEQPRGSKPVLQPNELVQQGRVNILLIGSDAGSDRTGLRSDSMIVASVNTHTGQAILFSLPRNLQNVPFPQGSPMHRFWPDGFNCGNDCLLNAVYKWADDKSKEDPQAFDNERSPGMTALEGAISETLGLPLDYYVIVDLKGFSKIVDALGGVTLRVEKRLPIGGGATHRITGWIEPGLQRLDGYHALWYARSRATTDDYDRMRRQRCVMGAIAREADPRTILMHYEQVAKTAGDAVSTNIPRDVLPDLVKIGYEVKQHDIESLTFTEDVLGSTANPDFAQIRQLVNRAIVRSDSPTKPSTAASTPKTPKATSGSTPTAGKTHDSDTPVPLHDVCRYS